MTPIGGTGEIDAEQQPIMLRWQVEPSSPVLFSSFAPTAEISISCNLRTRASEIRRNKRWIAPFALTLRAVFLSRARWPLSQFLVCRSPRAGGNVFRCLLCFFQILGNEAIRRR